MAKTNKPPTESAPSPAPGTTSSSTLSNAKTKPSVGPDTASVTSNKTSNSTTTTATKDQYQFTQVDKLKQKWRSLVSSIVVAHRTADKNSSSTTITKELDEAVLTTLKARNDFRKYVALIESNLLGQAQENAELAALYRSEPSCAGRRKRKRTEPVQQLPPTTILVGDGNKDKTGGSSVP